MNTMVTPGSVAAAGLGPGDLILKVGNVMATNLEHNDAMELVRQAGNILQLTIKKVENPSPPGPLSPPGGNYGSQVTAQLSDNNNYRGYNASNPQSFTVYSNTSSAPGYATTPRSFGSQQPQGTRIEIQRVNNPQPPPQPQRSMSYNYNDDDSNFPDYTIPYKQMEPVHDSPGGPVNISGYKIPVQQNNSYSSKSLPRVSSNNAYNDSFGGSGGPPAYEPRSYNSNQNSFSPSGNTESRFNTGVTFQPSFVKPPTPTYSETPEYSSSSQPYRETQSYKSPSQPYNSASNSYSGTAQTSYNSVPRPFSPPSYPGPMSPKTQTSSFVVKPVPYSAEPQSYSQSPGYGSNYDQSNLHGSGGNTYSTLPNTKSAYSSNDNNSFNTYNSNPNPYQQSSGPKPYTPTAYQPKAYQSPMSPVSSYPTQSAAPSSVQPPVRRVSFDQDAGTYSPSTNFSPRPYKSPPPVQGYSAPSYQPSGPADNYGVSDFGVEPVMQAPTFSRQGSRSNEAYVSKSYGPSGDLMSPRSNASSYGFSNERDVYDPSSISAGLDNMNLGSPRSYQPPPQAAPAPPPPPPPPPPPSAPPPPPAPPMNDWNPTPYRRQNYQQEEPEEQKIPDQLLNTMLKSAKGGGPKPFSYGIDLSELKKKMGPPTAPKPRKGQENYQQDESYEPPRPGPPKKPAGQVQSDYFLNRQDDDTPSSRVPKKPAGQVQTDYFLNRDEGPRAEIDESSLRVNMGTDPKKQSKSFKVLQWMTETEQDDPEGKQASANKDLANAPKPKRTKDPERRHNAEDDEMRFTGLHSKADIPSKAFGLLRKISTEDTPTYTPNGNNTLDTGDTNEETVGNYDETSIRYKGKSIPSPSFRVLQTWAEHDPNPDIKTSKREEEEEDGLPETLNSEEMVDRRYKGGNIPSKVFKHLQKTVGDEGVEAQGHTGSAAISDF
ncbi:uncharacterized protein LOC106078248 isoform X3 [Biomphalaria glabrata]|uniref:Uncharacterized protein LOC106078248 isoform X3 n=1 Tax=Biomphalaria glabrata TaxID=6526 RepID=A0A9W2ZM89_BIOGL|nr:uncharacterized protein LOC106078248 isoform X3 [Biomphalaria glabrata]